MASHAGLDFCPTRTVYAGYAWLTRWAITTPNNRASTVFTGLPIGAWICVVTLRRGDTDVALAGFAFSALGVLIAAIRICGAAFFLWWGIAIVAWVAFTTRKPIEQILFGAAVELLTIIGLASVVICRADDDPTIRKRRENIRLDERVC